MDPIALSASGPAVWSIQQQLLRDDAFIIGMYNADPRDHARTAAITAGARAVSQQLNMGGRLESVAFTTRTPAPCATVGREYGR